MEYFLHVNSYEMVTIQDFEVIPGHFNVLRMSSYFSATIISISCGLLDEKSVILPDFRSSSEAVTGPGS